MTTPPFRADHVGSLLRPPEVLAALDANRNGQMPDAALRAIEDEAIRGAVALQESVGLQAVTDGEFRRASFHFDFLGQLEGVEASIRGQMSAVQPAAPGAPFTPPQLRITGKVRHARPIEAENFRFVKEATRKTAKQAIPSPTMLLRGGRAGVSTEAYPDMEAFFADGAAAFRAEIKALADAGCTYLQLDDTNFAYLCDAKMREGLRQRGDDPDEVLRGYTRIVRMALAERPAGMTVCMHVCRGNSASQWAASGGYEPVAEAMFNDMPIDGYFLEFDSARAGGFEPLRFVPKGKRVVLGLVSSKTPALEPKDELRRRIDEAGRYMPSEAMALSPQCGFASNYRGNAMDVDAEKRKLALVVEMADEVWGAA
ncbi:MAG TPA: 5-methyltetrahydropteroyltriglutamate--homocysteine S-methyltransferase [Hyphomicrobiales bacterium]|nr:5-methyltetrahydropteroyltriglutamate--homocysteine S-methyltransferase [Hyphomicrobiales bacterium]